MRVDETLTEQTMFTVYDVIRQTISDALNEAGVPTLVDPLALDKQAREAIRQMMDRGILFREDRKVHPGDEETPEQGNKYGIVLVHESHKIVVHEDMSHLCKVCGVCHCHDKSRRLSLPCPGKLM